MGGILSVLLGVLTLTSALTYLVVPADQRLLVRAPEILPSVAQGASALQAEFWQLAALGLVGLGVVPAVTRRVARPDDDLLRWTAMMAIVGFAAMAVSNLLSLERLPKVAAAYAAGDESTRAALAALWRPTLDPWGILTLGAVGVWILSVSAAASRLHLDPRPLWLLGLALGVGFVLLTVAFGLGATGLFTVMIALVTLGSLAWYGWLGVLLTRGVRIPPGA